jgi:hypothetical protein
VKHTRLALALLVTSLAASSAFAASVTMLQFGSFETRDEAEKKLADISGKYGATLGALPTSIREVKLPPDNLTVYRTQAGPVADRSAAQSICAKLAATGDECYIVQTAMVGTPAANAVASTSPALLTTPLLSTPATTTVATPDLTSKLTPLQQPVDARDPMDRAALGSVNTPLANADQPPVSNTEASAVQDQQSAEMGAALDKAANNQSQTASDIDTSMSTAQAEQHRSFWQRMNPFSATPKAPVTPPAPPLVAAPVEVVSSEPLPPPVVAQATPSATIIPVTPTTPVTPITSSSTIVVPAVTAAAVATPTLSPLPNTPTQVTPAPVTVVQVVPPAATPVAAATPAPQPVGFDNSHVITQAPPMMLPPPPAPLRAQDREMLAAGKRPLPAPESTSAPIMVTPLPPTVVADNAQAPGNVQVEEARRVPVTTPLPAGAPTPFMQAPVVMQPSATEGIKTIWAQIGPFTSNDDALAYWANYRQNHPDFPVVRVRVTSSYQQLLHGVNSYSLRIGPIAQRAFVNALCQSLPAQPSGQEPLHCASISDLGMSSPLQPAPGYLPASRYSARH